MNKTRSISLGRVTVHEAGTLWGATLPVCGLWGRVPQVSFRWCWEGSWHAGEAGKGRGGRKALHFR